MKVGDRVRIKANAFPPGSHAESLNGRTGTIAETDDLSKHGGPSFYARVLLDPAPTIWPEKEPWFGGESLEPIDSPTLLVNGESATFSHMGVEVTITPSAGSDGAVVVFIDTEFEPDASDGGPGIRVNVNDGEVYEGIPYAPGEDHAD